MSQNIRASPCSAGRHGRIENVLGSGIAIMSDSSIGLKPVIEDPSNPIPPSNASASSVALIENAFSCPRMTVNHRRMKRMSRSEASEVTSSAVRGVSGIGVALWSGGGYLGGMATRLACMLIGAGAFALGSCGAGSGAAPKGAAAACQPAHARTLAADRTVRVFALSGEVYGCSERTRRVTRLGRSNVCIGTSRAGPAAVAGELAAYGLQTCGVDTGFSEVVVRRLSDGHVLRREGAITGTVGPESYGSVRSLVVRSDGGVAWIAV